MKNRYQEVLGNLASVIVVPNIDSMDYSSVSNGSEVALEPNDSIMYDPDEVGCGTATVAVE
jgi:hypothetical protein